MRTIMALLAALLLAGCQPKQQQSIDNLDIVDQAAADEEFPKRVREKIARLVFQQGTGIPRIRRVLSPVSRKR